MSELRHTGSSLECVTLARSINFLALTNINLIHGYFSERDTSSSIKFSLCARSALDLHFTLLWLFYSWPKLSRNLRPEDNLKPHYCIVYNTCDLTLTLEFIFKTSLKMPTEMLLCFRLKLHYYYYSFSLHRIFVVDFMWIVFIFLSFTMLMTLSLCVFKYFIVGNGINGNFS